MLFSVLQCRIILLQHFYMILVFLKPIGAHVHPRVGVWNRWWVTIFFDHYVNLYCDFFRFEGARRHTHSKLHHPGDIHIQSYTIKKRRACAPQLRILNLLFCTPQYPVSSSTKVPTPRTGDPMGLCELLVRVLYLVSLACPQIAVPAVDRP